MIVAVINRVLFWLGIVLVGQAVTVLPIHDAFERQWLYVSIGLAVFGLFLLLFQRWATNYEDDGLSCYDADGMGGQASNLLDHIGNHDD